MKNKVQLQEISPIHWALFNLPLGIISGACLFIIYLTETKSLDFFMIFIWFFLLIILTSLLSFIVGFFQALIINLFITFIGSGPVFEFTDFDSLTENNNSNTFRKRFRKKNTKQTADDKCKVNLQRKTGLKRDQL